MFRTIAQVLSINKIIKNRRVNIFSPDCKDKIEEIKDCSIHGLEVSMLKKAIATHLKSGPANHHSQPLGRWGVVDNFSKGYHYDHSI
jgi:hypothetical protein